MDDKNKDFGKDLLNNLDQQRDEAAAGAQIEATEEQRMGVYEAKAAVVKAENEAELEGGAQIEAAMAGRRPISEAEAKALLMEETQKTEKKLAKAHKNNKKIVIIAVVVAVVLCAAGLALAFMMGNNDDEAGDAGKNDTPVVDGGEEKPEEPEDEIVALDVNDPLVQRLYGELANVGGAYSSTLDFYTDKGVQNGNLDKEMMLDIAIGNASQKGKDCKAEHYIERGSESYEVGEMFGCRDGEEAREKIQEIFGIPIELNDGDKTGEYCGAWVYDAQNDEFYVPTLGCGGACLYSLTRELTSAEQSKNNIYLYETVYGGTCQSLTRVDGTVIAETTYDDNGNLVNSFNVDDYKDQLEKFRLIFTKNDSGEYVFTGLEKVE